MSRLHGEAVDLSPLTDLIPIGAEWEMKNWSLVRKKRGFLRSTYYTIQEKSTFAVRLGHCVLEATCDTMQEAVDQVAETLRSDSIQNSP